MNQGTEPHSMKIQIWYDLDGAKGAIGLTVIIDVFRAFSTACYVFNNGAEKIIPTGDVMTAYSIKKANPDYVLIGEQHGEVPIGFDFGNSPSQIERVSFSGKTVIHTTTKGTKGIANARNADEIITGSFVNAGAIVNYIKSRNPAIVSLVCTGTENEHILDEDALCAKYIKNELLDKRNNFEDIVQHLRESAYARYFFDPEIKSHPEEDFHFCMQLDKFDFVLRVRRGKNGPAYLSRI